MNHAQAKPTAPAVPGPARPASETYILCPYCGDATPSASRCTHCRGLLDPLSRQASQNAMGPWFLRDPAHPFRPGCSYETIAALVRRNKIGPQTVIRGPTTRQFWSIARRTPGVANLLGLCHACQADVQPEDHFCDDCGASFVVETQRQHLGLATVHLLPGQATPEDIAGASARAGAPAAGPSAAEGSHAVHNLQEAAAVRRVLERRLRTQHRMVWVLVVFLVVAGATGVWAGFRLVPGSPLAAWLAEAERRLVGPREAAPASSEPVPTNGPLAVPPESN